MTTKTTNIFLNMLLFYYLYLSVTANDYPSIVGATHMSGCYNLTTKPYLIEGAETISNMGSKVIKLELSNPETKSYQWNSIWPTNLTTPLLTAQYSYFQQVFSMNEYETYIMTTYTSLGGSYWRNGVNNKQYQQESDEIYDVAAYLLHTYPNKIFIFSNWEGDWAIRGNFNKSSVPTQQSINGMIQWYNARQNGVNRARNAYYNNTLHVPNANGLSSGVYMAAEVNLVVQSMQNNSFPNTIISVIPFVGLDLIAYSSYDSQCKDNFIDALQFIAEHHNKTSFSPKVSVYIGEFGLAQMKVDQTTLETCVKHVVSTAYNFGCPYIMFWEVYDNECPIYPNARCTVETGTMRNVTNLNGFWLVLPNGTHSWPYQYFQSLYNQ